MFRKFHRSSIFLAQQYLNNWLESNRCILCCEHTVGISWCENCLADFPKWDKNKPITIPYVDTVNVCFRYSYPIDKLIQAGKYRKNYGLVTALATLLPVVRESAGEYTVYPVPVSSKKLLRRGFNQTSVLAREKFPDKQTTIDEVSIHKRNFYPDQSTLDAAERKKNAAALFYSREFLSTEHALIIDDVITTGATVSAIAKILRNHGAKRVDVYALAAVP